MTKIVPSENTSKWLQLKWLKWLKWLKFLQFAKSNLYTSFQFSFASFALDK